MNLIGTLSYIGISRTLDILRRRHGAKGVQAHKHVLQLITNYYLESHDFNGISFSKLAQESILHIDKLQAILARLIAVGKIVLLSDEIDINPHIKRHTDPPVDRQLEILQNGGDSFHMCFYPSTAHLKTLVDESRYKGRPFTLMLALGEPQLSYRAFDLSVLEYYRNDPRYIYRCDDISGNISVSNEHYRSASMSERDKVVLESFGFAYDEDHNRTVAVLLRYLAGLSAEHQQVWHTKMLGSEYKLHPGYFRAKILGEWGTGVSIFAAFLEEMNQINQISILMGRQQLFRNVHLDEDARRKFGFLIRPTLEEFGNFVHLLDKIISENIDQAFFGDELELESEVTRKKDGKVIVTSKGTLTLLREWLNINFHTSDQSRVTEMLKIFKDIRTLRQHPAHVVDANVFDQQFFKRQRELMIQAYQAMQTLRMIFAMHPSAIEHKIPHWLEEGTIWSE